MRIMNVHHVRLEAHVQYVKQLNKSQWVFALSFAAQQIGLHGMGDTVENTHVDITVYNCNSRGVPQFLLLYGNIHHKVFLAGIFQAECQMQYAIWFKTHLNPPPTRQLKPVPGKHQYAKEKEIKLKVAHCLFSGQ